MSIVDGDIQEISNIIEKDGGIFKSNSFLKVPEELIEKSLSSKELIERFGFDNWYDWNVENLGTKWSFESEDAVNLSDGFFYFRTAWTPPSEFCQFLSEKFQYVVSLEFSNYLSDFSGIVVYNKGLPIQEEFKRSTSTSQGLDT
jgi:hypothetical protein